MPPTSIAASSNRSKNFTCRSTMSGIPSTTTGEQPTWGEGWSVGLRLWVERAGQAILGKGRLELLEGIDRSHSISAAARQMGMSYRRAWELVQSINQAAGEPLVITATGGAQGGGARLTPLGRRAVEVFRELQQQVLQGIPGHLYRLVSPPSAPTLHVAAAISLEEVLALLLTDFALRMPTIRVRSVCGASDELADQLLAGAPCDLFLTADTRQLDRLGQGRLVERGQQAVLAENRLAAIAASEASVAARTPADLCRVAIHHIALAAPDCPLGNYTRAYLEGLRLYERLLPRVVWVENSRAAVAAVRAGQADVGVVYSSDAARAAGCRTLFRTRRTPTPIRYSAVILGGGRDPASARALLDFLRSPPAARRFRQCGFLPVRKRS
jgi:molybdenum ABC transporter molybdate-binding protein